MCLAGNIDLNLIRLCRETMIVDIYSYFGVVELCCGVVEGFAVVKGQA